MSQDKKIPESNFKFLIFILVILQETPITMFCLHETRACIADFSTDLQSEIKQMGLIAADFSDDS